MSEDPESSVDNLPSKLVKIGDSQFDLYTGALRPDEITSFIMLKLKQKGCYSKNEYTKWITDANKEFRMIELPDGSCWTLRIGNRKGKYIHIHPGKYSACTVRIRSLTLKTIIAVLLWTKIHGGSPFDPDLINNVRTTILSASRISSLSLKKGLGKFILLFIDMTN